MSKKDQFYKNVFRSCPLLVCFSLCWFFMLIIMGFFDRARLCKRLSSNLASMQWWYLFCCKWSKWSFLFCRRISSVAGMLMFGNGFGLLYSCIGLVIGKQSDFACPLLWRSLCPAYFIAKKYQKFDELLTRKRKILKSTSCYLAASFAPDDLICLVAGLTKLSFRNLCRLWFSWNHGRWCV